MVPPSLPAALLAALDALSADDKLAYGAALDAVASSTSQAFPIPLVDYFNDVFQDARMTRAGIAANHILGRQHAVAAVASIYPSIPSVDYPPGGDTSWTSPAPPTDLEALSAGTKATLMAICQRVSTSTELAADLVDSAFTTYVRSTPITINNPLVAADRGRCGSIYNHLARLQNMRIDPDYYHRNDMAGV